MEIRFEDYLPHYDHIIDLELINGVYQEPINEDYEF